MDISGPQSLKLAARCGCCCRGWDERHSTEAVIRLWEEGAEKIRPLEKLKKMAENYGDDILGAGAIGRSSTTGGALNSRS